MTAKEIIKSIKKHKPSQGVEELSLFLMSIKKPRTILEIGTDRGGLSKVFRDVFNPEILIGIDINPKRFFKSYPGELLCPMDSHDPLTYEVIESKLGGNKLDLLFIDGDHTYEGLKKDYETYSKLCGKGSVIAIHDVGDLEPGEPEVVKFWEELDIGMAIIKDGPGIGVIHI